MIRLNLSYFYRLSGQFAPVRTWPIDTPVRAIWFEALKVEQTLKAVFNDEIMLSCLRSTQGPASELYSALDAITSSDMEKLFTEYDKAELVRLLDNFEAVLQSELAVANSYYVTDKAPYSTVQLVDQGQSLFSADVAAKVPAALDDLQAAGKCLAFELGTACGFHTMRALEAVLRRYWEAVTGNAPHPKQRNIGVYLRAMGDKSCGDPKVIAALKQIKDLHRNVITHPEDTLTVNEAIGLMGLARSAADAMLKDIPETPFALTAPEPAPPQLDGGA